MHWSTLPLLLLAVVVALSSISMSTDAASSGNLAYCDLGPTRLYGWNKNATSPKGVMPWVLPPKPTTFYTIRTADTSNPATDPTSYTPGVLTAIHIRTLDLDRRFIGLVLYATNSTGAKVGRWSVPAEAPFQTPSTCNPVGSAVTHSDADLKPLHVVLYVTIPKGAGVVNFQILIKQGEQNRGEFFFPAVPLSLTEGAPLTAQPVTVGAVGLSCDDVCGAQNATGLIYCDQASSASLNDPTVLVNAGLQSGALPCRFPLISGCDAVSPKVDDDGYCYYRSSSASCSADTQQAWAQFDCAAKATDTNRVCVCSASASARNNPIPSDNGNGTSGSTGSAAKSAHVSFWTMALTSALSFHMIPSSMKRMTMAMVMAMAMVMCLMTPTTVSAHNWVHLGPHRSLVASVAKPCQARVGNQPHIQVGPTQRFQLGWSVGHGDSGTKNFYWVTLHASDYDKLSLITQKDLENYIANAPASARLTGNTWTKRHIAPKANAGLMNPGYFDRILTVNDTEYIPRDPVMIQRSNMGNADSSVNQYLFLANATASDIRVAYLNPNYTWIESVSRFRNSFFEHTPYASQSDYANFRLEGRKGPGDYIVHFWWGGYRDCVDVNLYKTNVANRYGLSRANSTVTFQRLDHCEFTNVMNPSTQCSVIGSAVRNASICLQRCKAMTRSGCLGVNAVRAFNTKSALPYVENIPHFLYNGSQVADPNAMPPVKQGPCGYRNVRDRVKNGCQVVNKNCNLTALNPGPEDYICYGLVPFRDQDLQAVEDYQIFSEPEDPRFLSTCWLRIDDNGFLDVPKLEPLTPKWSAGDKCVKCSFVNTAKNTSIELMPRWEDSLSDKCKRCDRDL